MTHNEIAARVRGHIQETYLYMRPGATFTDTDPLLGRGIIDSMGVIELVAFLEDEMGVTVADEDLTETNLGSVAAITAYVATQRATRMAS